MCCYTGLLYLPSIQASVGCRTIAIDLVQIVARVAYILVKGDNCCRKREKRTEFSRYSALFGRDMVWTYNATLRKECMLSRQTTGSLER